MTYITVMRTRMIPTASENEALTRLGRTIRLARLRRRLSQSDFAERMGVSRSSYCLLEAGDPRVSMGSLLKALSVFGYTDRFAELLAADPIGDDIEQSEGRRRAGRRTDVVDF